MIKLQTIQQGVQYQWLGGRKYKFTRLNTVLFGSCCMLHVGAPCHIRPVGRHWAIVIRCIQGTSYFSFTSFPEDISKLILSISNLLNDQICVGKTSVRGRPLFVFILGLCKAARFRFPRIAFSETNFREW